MCDILYFQILGGVGGRIYICCGGGDIIKNKKKPKSKIKIIVNVIFKFPYFNTTLIILM